MASVVETHLGTVSIHKTAKVLSNVLDHLPLPHLLLVLRTESLQIFASLRFCWKYLNCVFHDVQYLRHRNSCYFSFPLKLLHQQALLLYLI